MWESPATPSRSVRSKRQKKQRSPEKYNFPRDAKTLTYTNRCPPEPAGSGEPAWEPMARPMRSGERWTASSETDQRILLMPIQRKTAIVRYRTLSYNANRRRPRWRESEYKIRPIASPKGGVATHLAPKGRLPLTSRPARTGAARGEIP